MADISSVEPHIGEEALFVEYISQRKPVVIKGFPDDRTFAAQKWSLDYLASRVRGVRVLVEPLHPTIQQFGTDVERIFMQFSDFLHSLKSNSGPYHYLTTQYSSEEWDALTVFSPPTDMLRDDFPGVPRLMGNLFLQQANLWLGKSKCGSSSGLHHDFHDNLYCLLKGQKRFVLFPPQEHENLYPHGTIHAMHKNGVIAYDRFLRADGLNRRVALRARVAALKGQLDALDAKGKGKSKGKAKSATKERKALEMRYSETREELQALAEDEQDEYPLEEDDDDYDDERLEDGSDLGSLAGDIEGEDDYDALMGGNAADGESVAGEVGEGRSEDHAEKQDNDTPSFSRIPTALLHKHLGLATTAVTPPDCSLAEFPNLAKASQPYVIELSAGEMLYLPASWWHEVTSSSDAETDVHMALNWWFYPPDADSFEEPYEDKEVWDHLRVQARKEMTKVLGGGEGKRKRDAAEEATMKRARK